MFFEARRKTMSATQNAPELAAARAALRRMIRAPERQVVEKLQQGFLCAADVRERSVHKAEALVVDVRGRRNERSLLDTFLLEFGLSNEEGVALMCLAEALLRVPDGETADALIADKILSGDWATHLGESDSPFVNASTWALMLTGEVIALETRTLENPAGWLKTLVGRVGEPVIRKAMIQAMRILGREFVLGRTIEEGCRRGRKEFGRDAIFSFDMLGEGARTRTAAEKYFEAYSRAIESVSQQGKKAGAGPASGISVKLSALHPRYEFSQRARVMDELGARLMELARRAAAAGMALTVDAEEADRLDLSLDLFERVARQPDLDGWDGLGLAIQAYGKRAPAVIDWLASLAFETGRRFQVRLVKGAYWDMEIKRAQEQGLADYPVFTRKVTTDLSYLACAQKLLAQPEVFYAQFATHNAHTLVAVMEMAGAHRGFEFQRLHGMGTLLYRAAQDHYDDLPPVRIYAPIGGHRDLLAYLVRRLLENGANSSFVNRFLDGDIPARDVVRDPVRVVLNLKTIRHQTIPLPMNLFGEERLNSRGMDFNNSLETARLSEDMARYQNEVYESGPAAARTRAASLEIRNPADQRDVVGRCVTADETDIEQAFERASHVQPAWDEKRGAARADILARAADLLESRRAFFMSLLVREAGKTLPDALAEVREAIDFCRYYGVQARRHFESARPLPGPTGEDNALSLHGRGVFVCISPWNFPLAIFMGQVAAALASGNGVVAKPAEQTPLIGAQAIKLLHEAGVPRDLLHFLPGGGDIGQKLVAHPCTAGVVFTGSTQTGRAINQALAARPGPIVPLIAETGGQNAMFVDSTALLEQVSDDVIQSAFLSAGQRCSALRVLYVQDDIANETIEMICGAMDALRLGNPSDLATDIGPVIDRQAVQSLQRHIQIMTLTARHTHACSLSAETTHGTFVAPHLFEIDRIDQLTQEHFGPILHVIRYRAGDLDARLMDLRKTGYGLTLGIHTRIEARAKTIFNKSNVGNVYVNRNMVGAVVGVQPFGGQGLSGTGPKAGGPHYLLRFAAEKTWTANTMASGGNRALLNLSD